jgi:hypothetical protein
VPGELCVSGELEQAHIVTVAWTIDGCSSTAVAAKGRDRS